MRKLTERTTALHSFRIDLDDVQRVFDRLLELVKEQGRVEVETLQKPEDKSDEEFAVDKVDIFERAFRVTVTISGEDGDSLYGDSRELFTSPNLPERIKLIYMTNMTAYQAVASVRPNNRFELSLDFSKPPLLDDKNFVSSPTANHSVLHIWGEKDSWIAAVSEAVSRMIFRRTSKRRWLHRGFVYDYGMLLLGLPFALYTCWNQSPLIERILGSAHPVVSGAAYIYIVVGIVFAYRVLFGYAKWAFPIAELNDNKDAAAVHRKIFGAILLALAAQLVWTIITHQR